MKILTVLIFLVPAVSWAAFGDKFQGTWTGSGTVDDFTPNWGGLKRQAISSCKNVTTTISTAKNQFNLDMRYQCGLGLPSGNTSFSYQLRDVVGKNYREIFDPGPPVAVRGRVFDDRLDLVEHIDDATAGDLTGVFAELMNSKQMRFRRSWTEIAAEKDSLQNYLSATLRK